MLGGGQAKSHLFPGLHTISVNLKWCQHLQEVETQRYIYKVRACRPVCCHLEQVLIQLSQAFSLLCLPMNLLILFLKKDSSVHSERSKNIIRFFTSKCFLFFERTSNNWKIIACGRCLRTKQTYSDTFPDIQLPKLFYIQGTSKPNDHLCVQKPLLDVSSMNLFNSLQTLAIFQYPQHPVARNSMRQSFSLMIVLLLYFYNAWKLTALLHFPAHYLNTGHHSDTAQSTKQDSWLIQVEINGTVIINEIVWCCCSASAGLSLRLRSFFPPFHTTHLQKFPFTWLHATPLVLPGGNNWVSLQVWGVLMGKLTF